MTRATARIWALAGAVLLIAADRSRYSRVRRRFQDNRRETARKEENERANIFPNLGPGICASGNPRGVLHPVREKADSGLISEYPT
jgi:hypothetical protein